MTALFSLLVVYSVGVAWLYYQAKEATLPNLRFKISCWTIVSFACYVVILEIKQGTFYFLLPSAILLFFFLNYRRNKTLLFNGFLFNLFLLSFSFYLFYHYLVTRDFLLFCLLFCLLVCLAIIGLFFFLFGTWSLILLLVWNARFMIRRVGRSITNLLTLILAIFLILMTLYDRFIVTIIPEWLATFLSIIPFSFVYFSLMFVNFLTISLIYQLNRPAYNQDYIIVLGAGLLDGVTVTPLLAQRIDRALAFYTQQKTYTKQPPKIIFSGGQGPDEQIPEAVAMQNYALEKGYPLTDLLLEDQSTTTFENMKFSKRLIDQQRPQQAKVIFTSNNYHIFRGGVYARLNHLHADGLGSKTALYYLPTAFLREFIAMIAMHRRTHFLFLAGAGIVFFLLALVTIITG